MFFETKRLYPKNNTCKMATNFESTFPPSPKKKKKKSTLNFEVEVSNMKCFFLQPPRKMTSTGGCLKLRPFPTQDSGAKVMACSVDLGGCHEFPQAIFHTFHLGTKENAIFGRKKRFQRRGSVGGFSTFGFGENLPQFLAFRKLGSKIKARRRTSDTRMLLFMAEILSQLDVFFSGEIQ